MAFCANCGTQVQDGVNFCPSCGATVGGAPAQQQAPGQQGYAARTAEQDAQENKAISILAYILFFVPLLTGAHKTSPFAKYHTNQGTVLFLASLAVSIVLGILFGIISAILTATFAWRALLGFATLSGVVWLVYSLAVLALVIIGILNAVNGKMKPLPVIGKFTIVK
jgi:uncharacterized membrane protein